MRAFIYNAWEFYPGRCDSIRNDRVKRYISKFRQNYEDLFSSHTIQKKEEKTI